MVLDPAVTFIQKNGNPIELARLAYLLYGEAPTLDVIAGLFAGQRDDGGWPPFWAPHYSSLDATCFRLAQAEALGLIAGEHPAVQHAARFLSQRQHENGSFEEEDRIASAAPAWATPGDLSARLYLTANCGFWISIIGQNGTRIQSTTAFLQAHLDAAGQIPSFMQTHWLAAGLWLHQREVESSEMVVHYLQARLPDLPASNLAWMSVTLLVAGLPSTHPLIVGAIGALERLREEDGRWRSEDGPQFDVHTTLEALRVFHLAHQL